MHFEYERQSHVSVVIWLTTTQNKVFLMLFTLSQSSPIAHYPFKQHTTDHIELI